MRVLFVIANLANGGAERVLSALSSHLVRKNEVHIAVLERDFGFYEFDKSIKFHTPQIYGGNKFVSKFKKIVQLRTLFKDIKPDLIISFIDWTNVACVVANFGLNFRHIATEHNANEYLQSPIFRFIRDMAYKKVDALSVLSKRDFNYYNFVKNRKILHNPFFLKKSDNTAKENIILSVGRLEAVKGYDVYFKALAKLKPEILHSWRIVIAGDGSLKDELENMAENFGLNVEFLGHITDISILYKKAKIFVISSRNEGLPNVLIESGAFGCARISSNTTGGCELITNGIDGVLFECENDDELASVLNELLCNESLILRLGQNAEQNSSEFDCEKIMAKWDKFIDEVMNR